MGVPGVQWHSRILSVQLTLSQPRGADYVCPPYNAGNPEFSDLPTARQAAMLRSRIWNEKKWNEQILEWANNMENESKKERAKNKMSKKWIEPDMEWAKNIMSKKWNE